MLSAPMRPPPMRYRTGPSCPIVSAEAGPELRTCVPLGLVATTVAQGRCCGQPIGHMGNNVRQPISGGPGPWVRCTSEDNRSITRCHSDKPEQQTIPYEMLVIAAIERDGGDHAYCHSGRIAQQCSCCLAPVVRLRFVVVRA